MIKMQNSVLKFARENAKSDELCKLFRDYWNHYNFTYYKKAGDFDKQFSLDEKNEKINNAMKTEIARRANIADFSSLPAEQWITHPLYKWATFSVVTALVEMILPETIIDSMGIYTDVRVGGYGDNFLFKVKPKDLFVVSKAGHGGKHAEVIKQFDGNQTVTPEFHDITVAVSLYRVLSGEENLAEFAIKVARSIESKMTVDAYNCFAAYVNALPDDSGSAKAGSGALKITGFSQDTATKLAATVTAYNQGAKAVFVGTQVALSKIIPANSNYRYDIESQYVKVGYIPTAFGYDLMVLPQVADIVNQYSLVLDDTKVYVLSPSSQKLVKLCLEGSLISITDGVYDNSDLTQEMTMKKSWGCAVASNATCGVITLS